jgi:YD repeat-containing protein
MRRVVAMLSVAACGGAPAVAPRPTTPPEHRPVVAAAPAVVTLPANPVDEAGLPHGLWVVDCDGVEEGCRGWFEHGVQVQWALIEGVDRYVIDAIDGGWRWQWWSGDRLRQEAGLAVAPAPWATSGVTFGELMEAPTEGACAGRFRNLREDGRVESSGVCDGTRWIEWSAYDAEGRERVRTRRDGTRTEVEQWDPAGKRVARTITDGTDEASELWSDGTLIRKTLSRDGVVVENRGWDRDGQRTEEDVTTGADRRLRRWSETGQLVASATWHAGKRTGWVRTWYDSGRRRTAVQLDAKGKPKGPMIVWDPRGKKVAEAALDRGQWMGPKARRGTWVVSVRPVPPTTTIPPRFEPTCNVADPVCVRDLLPAAYDPLGCLRPRLGDPLAVWRGRATIRLGIDAAGTTVVVAIPDAGGLTPDHRRCLLSSAREASQQVDIELQLDLLVGKMDPPPPPITDINFADSLL